MQNVKFGVRVGGRYRPAPRSDRHAIGSRATRRPPTRPRAPVPTKCMPLRAYRGRQPQNRRSTRRRQKRSRGRRRPGSDPHTGRPRRWRRSIPDTVWRKFLNDTEQAIRASAPEELSARERAAVGRPHPTGGCRRSLNLSQKSGVAERTGTPTGEALLRSVTRSVRTMGNVSRGDGGGEWHGGRNCRGDWTR